LLANNSEILKRAQYNSLSSDKSQVYRAYNDYKNLYVRSLMNGDENLCTTCLKGLVKTGKKLHIDVKNQLRKKFLLLKNKLLKKQHPPSLLKTDSSLFDGKTSKDLY